MIELYDEVTQACSKITTKRYSTSFSLGIRVFERQFRTPIYNIYGFVRFADEIVDTFHGHDKALLLDRFRADTARAISERISLNPILHAFQKTVHEFGIEQSHIDAFLDSMAMDLDKTSYTQSEYEKYIFGSAEVIGLMCLKVFCEGDQGKYDQLETFAKSLGSAFQKINFLRDIKSDYEERGRVYFPNVNYHSFDEAKKMAIESDIQKDFDLALEGIRGLPKCVRLGVYLAYRYYTNLFKKIKSSPANLVQEKRIRVRNRRKIYLLASSTIKDRLNIIT